MAEGETEKEYDTRKAIDELRERFQGLVTALKESPHSPLEATLRFCQEFCQVLVEHASRWKSDEDPLPQLEVYTLAILNFSKAISSLSSECDNVTLLLEKLAQSCVELLLLLPQHVPGALWEEFQTSIKLAHNLLQESGNTQLTQLAALAQQEGVWSNSTLSSILAHESPPLDKVHEYLELEGPTLLTTRIKHLMKMDSVDKASTLAKICSEYSGFEGKGTFKQTYLLCICMTKSQEPLMEEIASVDCKEALEMICNLESEGDENGALCICSAFLKRQLLQGEVYCAWELTLFWSKLLIRLETSAEGFLSRSKDMAHLSRSVCHILFLIKVIQNEVGEVGLPVCVEMCIQALKMTSSDHKESKSTICKTISCLLPSDLEVKRACQLTEFLIQPTIDSYYAVETLYNEPDQKPEEDGSLPVPNSLRCELLLALKTQWPFDPEFWDWKTLKRNCLTLMGDEAAIVSSIDTLNDTDDQEVESGLGKLPEYKDLEDFLLTTTNELNEITDEKEKNREAKKLREQGFVSARFRNWRAYMQYCVLCDKEFLGHRIVRHAQKHFKDGMYLCPICADGFASREVLEPHVAIHVKQSCKERLAAMKASRKGTKPPQITNKNVNSVTSENGSQLENPVANSEQPQHDPSQDCFCPVSNCNKAFKFFRNLMAHVRSHKDDEEAMRFLEIQKQKVVCQYCRRQFVNVQHLNDHLQMHCGTRPYICIQLECKASFNSNSELLMHRKLHPEFKAMCMFPNCGQIFSEAYLLYDHEAQHYLTYTCSTNNCGKIFYSQEQFLLHQQVHNPNAVANLTNEKPPHVQPANDNIQIKDETLNAVGCHERINSHEMTDTEASTAHVISPKAVNDPVIIKHKVENMLNQEADAGVREPEKCYTPLTNPTPTPAEVNPAPETQQQTDYRTAEVREAPPPYPSTTNNVTNQQAVMHNNEFPKAFPISPDQIKTEIPYSLQGYGGQACSSEENLHCCPFSDCTRSYSTNKSLSRHVKKQHPEIFEGWKLAKKYSKVAKIAARKAPVSPNKIPLGKRPANQSGTLSNKPGVQHTEYPPGCSTTQSYPSSMDPVPITQMINPSVYPPWASPNHSEIQQDASQPWSSASTCYSDNFNVNEYPSRGYPHWQADTYQPTTSTERDSGAAGQSNTSESSLMSQYVSSSLMLDNGGQVHNGAPQYGLVHPETRVDGGSENVRKASTETLGNENSISTVDSLNDGSYNTPCTPSENSCPTMSSSVDVPEKPTSPKADTTLKADEADKKDDTSDPTCEHLEDSVDGMSPNRSNHADMPHDEDCPNADSDEKNDDDPDAKERPSGWGKRSKWPGIIKEGKVICRRCFREFTSTKSLGGHLSKRSQCKPTDEIDLTADLPSSFLDFLNDPMVPDTNAPVYNMSNGEFSQESSSLATLSPMALKQEPINTYCGEFSQSSLSNDNPLEKMPVPYHDNLMEMSNAFQNNQNNMNLEQIMMHGGPSSSTGKSKTHSKNQDKMFKPFKCDQDDCEFSFMTKEALFKHLSRMHDFTNEMIDDLKRSPAKLSPYPCQICSKTFTRTTGLRIHYEKVHRLSPDEMLKLKISARNRRAFKLTKDDTPFSCSVPGPSANIMIPPTITPPITITNIKQEVPDMAFEPIPEPYQGPGSDVILLSPQRDVEQENLTHEVSTVTRLPSPPNYFNDLTVPLAPITPLEDSQGASTTNIESFSPKSPVKEKQSPGRGGKEKQRYSITAIGTTSPEKPGSSKHSPAKNESPKKDALQKKLGLTMCDLDNMHSPYRPYRCVHEGCTAAFTIQQNLILHYRAMHQASLPPTNADEENASDPLGADSIVTEEVMCQVKNCSRVFTGITTLVQHYLLLHKFTRDKATSMMSTMSIRPFKCDRPECALSFDSVEGYIEHIKNFHKDIAITENGLVDATFKCQYEACDRVYSTKSNLLRHLIKKHDYVYDPKATDGRRIKSVGLFSGLNNEKENVEVKVRKKNTNKRKDGKMAEHWTSFGEPTLKSHEEASAICNKNYVLQYPCMIIGCDAVERAERDIFKHYTTHGLTEKVIEEQRGQFILCRKYSRTRLKDTNKSEGASSSCEEAELDNGEKPSELLDEMKGNGNQDRKNNVTEFQSSTGTKVPIKRGRPRKSAQPIPACPQRKQTLRNRRGGSHPATQSVQENTASSFKPLGMEDSFIQFLQTSDTCQASKRKIKERPSCELPPKRSRRQKSAWVKTKVTQQGIDSPDTLVDFRNPVKLRFINNVKIVVDNSFSDGADEMLKQLQKMKPLVVIKCLHCLSS